MGLSIHGYPFLCPSIRRSPREWVFKIKIKKKKIKIKKPED